MLESYHILSILLLSFGTLNKAEMNGTSETKVQAHKNMHSTKKQGYRKRKSLKRLEMIWKNKVVECNQICWCLAAHRNIGTRRNIKGSEFLSVKHLLTNNANIAKSFAASATTLGISYQWCGVSTLTTNHTLSLSIRFSSVHYVCHNCHGATARLILFYLMMFRYNNKPPMILFEKWIRKQP